MNTNDLNTALYEKMADEQDKYRAWLKRQPPEEILHHTYEYTVREDIVMAMEEGQSCLCGLHPHRQVAHGRSCRVPHRCV